MDTEMTKIITQEERLFKDLYPFIKDDDVTDIKWNGRDLWIDDLNKGRYKSDVKLTNEFLEIFMSRIAHEANVHFNTSVPSLQAEYQNLRIHGLHHSVTGDEKYVLAIRKTPAVARINNDNIIRRGYADALFVELIGALIRAHRSGMIIGDVGSGKTELEKYIAGFIPDNESVMTVEDTLEMKLNVIYPDKDVSSVKIDNKYDAVQAIRDALRLLVKWLLIAEARGREISTIFEGASTGCVAWSTVHTENVWEIPDRCVQMAGADVDKDAFENTFYMFFDVGIKVKRVITDEGIFRYIDQLCFFTRDDKVNRCTVFMNNGKYTGKKIPDEFVRFFIENKEVKLINMLQEKGMI